VVAHDVPEREFRADGVLPGPVADGQPALAQSVLAVEVPYPHVVAHGPRLLLVEEVLVAGGGGGVLDEVFQRALAFVLLWVQLDGALALHV